MSAELHFTQDPSGVVHRRHPSEKAERHQDEREITQEQALVVARTQPDHLCRRCFPGNLPTPPRVHDRKPRKRKPLTEPE